MMVRIEVGELIRATRSIQTLGGTVPAGAIGELTANMLPGMISAVFDHVSVCGLSVDAVEPARKRKGKSDVKGNGN